MIKIPERVPDGELMYKQSLSYYSNINFLFKYVKEVVLEHLFIDGQNTFGEIITNYARPDLRPSELEKEEEEKRFNKQSNYCSIKILTDYNDITKTNMQGFDSPFAMTNAVNKFTTILKDNLFTLSFNSNYVKLNVDINIQSSDTLRLTDYAGFIKSRVHIGKGFYIADRIPLKFVIDQQLISFLKVLYPEFSDDEFETRLNELTGDNIFKEVDNTTGNASYFVNINTRPLLKITSMSDDGILTLAMEMEVYLPNKFLISSLVSYDEILDLTIRREIVSLVGIDDITEKERIINFNPDYIEKNRDRFSFTDEELVLIRQEKLFPIVSLASLNPDEYELIGNYNEGFATIENIRIRLEEQVTNTEYISKVTSIVSPNNDFTKVSSLIVNVLKVDDDLNADTGVISIFDEVFIKNFMKNPREDIMFMTKILNKEVAHTVEYNADKSCLEFDFKENIYGKTVSLTLFRRI